MKERSRCDRVEININLLRFFLNEARRSASRDIDIYGPWCFSGHLLKDLSSEVFEKVETKLNNRTLGINGWRKVGEGMDVSMDHLDTFELEYQKIGGSPARALFNYITARSPDELTRTFVELLCQKDRNDIAKIICEWDWPSKTGAAVDCNH